MFILILRSVKGFKDDITIRNVYYKLITMGSYLARQYSVNQPLCLHELYALGPKELFILLVRSLKGVLVDSV